MKIAVLPGDGVGTEVIAEAVKVIAALSRGGLAFEIEHASVGGAAYDTSGDPLPEPTLDLARKADAILFGAVAGWGLWFWLIARCSMNSSRASTRIS